MMKSMGQDSEYLVNYLQSLHEITIPEKMIQEWQNIVDLAVRITGVRSGLIMRINQDELEVYVSSATDGNPYVVGEKTVLHDSGLYCEKVITKQENLLVANALVSEAWKNNPDLKHHMISYLGFPIKLPNRKPFGTICLLHDKENQFSSDIVQLMEKMRDLIEGQLTLLYFSCIDQLTGLYNRAYFSNRTKEEIAKADRLQQPVSLLMLDLDFFKRINDTYGHLIGDEILKLAAKVTSSNVREGDLIARFGGEEFIILMPNTSIVGAMSVAENIRAEIENTEHKIAGKFTVSIGVAERIGAESFDDWCRRADESLYHAKRSGRNIVVASENLERLPLASVRLDWSKAWESRNREIDQQHKELIFLANRLINMSYTSIGHQEIINQFNQLLDHIKNHFTFEEDYLASIGYPETSEHAKTHNDLIKKAMELKNAYENGTIKASAFFAFVVDDVIMDHIIASDTKFYPYINDEE